MRKLYFSIFALFIAFLAQAQCPVINGAMIKPCINTAGEGINEFLFFTTTEAGTAGDYVMYYGSNTPPKTSPTNILSGANAAAKTGTGSVTASGGCTVHVVTSATTAIPANSRVLFIPNVLDQQYDVSSICSGGNIYVVFIDITVSPSNWNANGSFANSASASRYIQITKGANNCTAGIRSYTNEWPTSVGGNAVSWNSTGEPTYFNNGCTDVVTPVKLFSFNVTGKGSNAHVVWKTVSELNALAFDVERSSEELVFKSMASVISSGNSNQLKTYSHTDLDIPAGTNYYRLKMLDRDGHYSYSPIVKIVNSHRRFEITNLYPKPAASMVTLSWNAATAGATEVGIFDLSGRQLLKKEVTGLTGMNRADINVSSLTAGNYYIRLSKDGAVQTAAFSK